MRFGGLEILLIFIIIMLFFGPKQIPKLTSTIKDSIKDLKSKKPEEIETFSEEENSEEQEDKG